MGRPSSYTTEVGAEICRRLAEGESLRAICQDDGMPIAETVREWALADRGGFSLPYARAREMQQQSRIEEIGAMADAATVEDYRVVEMRIKQRQWEAERLLPKVYGPKVQQDITVRRAAEDLTDDELAALAAGKEAANG